MLGSYSFTDDATPEYKHKNIIDWTGEDCGRWASDAEKVLNIPLSSWVSLDGFYKTTGRDLLRFTSKDFRRIVNDEYGPLFYKLFKKHAKESSPIKESNIYYDQSMSLDFNENTTWTVPQIDIPDYDVSMSDNGSHFGSTTLPPLSFEDSLASPGSHLSPSYGHSSLSTNDSCSYGSLSPSYGGLSPTFNGMPSSYGSLSPLPPESGDFSCSSSSNSTYFTQPSILSGGSLSYGASGGNIPEDLDSNLLGTSPYTSLLPDFNSLMIADGGCDKASNPFDLYELDVTLKQETFSDLDHYIHCDTSTNPDFETLDEAKRNYASNRQESTLLSPSDQGSLEDSMLKKITTGKRGNRVRHPQSWEFLVRLLINPKTNPSLIKWEDKKNGIFRLVQKEEIAKLWGKRSQKHKDEPLAYDNFARILRYHYKSKVLLPVSDKHLVYKLGDKVLEDLRAQNLLQS